MAGIAPIRRAGQYGAASQCPVALTERLPLQMRPVFSAGRRRCPWALLWAAGFWAGYFHFLACGLAQPVAGNELWQRQSIYQIITDRFFDGDPTNDNADGNYDPAGHRGTSVHGGDFKGIEDKLDYIKSLGATAIWISPIVLNVHGEFHGYDGFDFYRVDPHWGTLADLQHLVAAAHARGLLVIDDVVVNHGGDLVYSTDPGYPDFKYPPAGYTLRFRDPARQYPPPFDLNATHPALTNLFHNQGYVQDYNDATQLELGELSGLDDLRTETPYVREQMKKIYEYWIAAAGFDAFRIDTVKHVDMGFWREWCPAIHAFAAAQGKPDFFLFGEVPTESDRKCGSYTGTMGDSGGPAPFKLDSVLDYPLYFKIGPVFARATASPAEIEQHYCALAANYDPAAQGQLVTFLDNHDQPRFLSEPGATINRLKVALVFLYTARGIPCLYYGTEQGFDGGKDPWDREDMFAGQFEWGPSRGDNFNMTHPLYQWVARLNNFRRLYPALQTGEQTCVEGETNGPGIYAYTRRLAGQEALVVLNPAGSPRVFPGCRMIYPAGTRLQNLLAENESMTVGADGRLPAINMPETSAKIFIAANEVRSLDPVVTKISPEHDTEGNSQYAWIRMHFSQPMDANSVERAFSIKPAAPGVFSWSEARDALIFKPQGQGFPPGALVTVRLAPTAHAADSGRSFYAGFESRFTCN